MDDISSNNLNAHYTNKAKVELSTPKVACPPKTLPRYHTFNDTDANKKFETVNKDIYERKKSESDKSAKRFWTAYLAIVAAILAVIGIKRIFK